jgi:primosomal protein N' (replication factor Y)
MTSVQPAFDVLATKKRAPRTPKPKTAAEQLPVARVILDVQATHLGQMFDYLIEEKDSEQAQPGVQVRVRFGGQRVNGIIWERAAKAANPNYESSLRYIEKVISPLVLCDAEMRRDIEVIADNFGGTLSNIIRVAIPRRVARIEKEWGAQTDRHVSSVQDAQNAQSAKENTLQQTNVLLSQYDGFQELLKSFDSSQYSSQYSSYVWDTLPGMNAGVNTWVRDIVWCIDAARKYHRGIVVCLPTHRAVARVSQSLQEQGLEIFHKNDSAMASWSGEVAVLDSSSTVDERYRAYLALSTGKVSCVIGTRSAMYAPMHDNAVFMVMDDIAYQNSDGFMPYANVRDVLKLRAREHKGIFISIGAMRSPESEYEVVSSKLQAEKSKQIHGFAEVIKQLQPWTRWMNRQELEQLEDPTIGARIPQSVTRVLSKALAFGPVLLSVPFDGFVNNLVCAKCRQLARCNRCAGPLKKNTRNELAVCGWCGQVANDWSCKFCGNTAMRVVRIGAQGTAQELRTLFRGVPIVVSTPHQPRGVVEEIDPSPKLVIATPGAEPLVRDKKTQEIKGYQAIAILDAWTANSSQALDARMDALGAWMNTASEAMPREDGGQVLLVGDCDPKIATSLVAWDPRILAKAENKDRYETALPPFVCAASVWGKYSEVLKELDAMDLSDIQVGAGAESLPAVLGPIGIRPATPTAETKDKRIFDESNDRVRAIVRVPRAQRIELAKQLRSIVSRRAAHREQGEFRFWIAPKDLRER